MEQLLEILEDLNPGVDYENCEDLIDGRFIAGAGGGGFLMVILKDGVSRAMLRERLSAVFEGSGVEVWDAEFV